jgi:hypothetical protein
VVPLLNAGSDSRESKLSSIGNTYRALFRRYGEELLESGHPCFCLWLLDRTEIAGRSESFGSSLKPVNDEDLALLSKAIPNSLKRIIAHASPPSNCGNLSAEVDARAMAARVQIQVAAQNNSPATGTPLRGID